MSPVMAAPPGIDIHAYARMHRKMERSAREDNWVTMEATFPQNGNCACHGPARGDDNPIGGSRCREPVGGFAEAWDSAGDHQPAGVRARSTFEDTPTQSIEPASHTDGFGRSVYRGLSADPRPARRGRAHRLRGISGTAGRTYGDGVNGSRPPSCRAGRGGVSRRLSGGAGAPPPDGSRD